MNKRTIFLVLIGLILLNGCKNSTDLDYGKYENLRFGAIKPKGWIANQMERDLDSGITGHFDEFGKTVTHNLFVNSDRISGKRYDGLKCWWSGEHEGYWKDAVLRGAFLIDHSGYKERAKKWVNDILSSRDESGYIGIYAKDNRFQDTWRNKLSSTCHANEGFNRRQLCRFS